MSLRNVAPFAFVAIFSFVPSPVCAPRDTPRSLDGHARESHLLAATYTEPPVIMPQPTAVAETASPAQGLGGAHEETPPQTQAPTVCTPHWAPASHEQLDRCIAGDGDGCLAIGDEYVGGCDAYSSIKWFRRGCSLGSRDACSSLAKVDGT